MIRLLIDATGSSGWIGGVYHKKNILFSLRQNQWIRDNCRICVVTNPEHKELFSEFDGVSVYTISYKGLREKKIRIAILLTIHRCTHMFPNIDSRICSRLHVTGINWVPDYQHYHYPEYFTEPDLEEHKRTDIMTVDSGYPLILSSQSCLNDFRQYVSKTKENVYVVPFVSYIEKEVHTLSDEYVAEICSKFGIEPRNYVIVANQFWQHKNHAIVFEAIKRLSNEQDIVDGTVLDNTRFVFTGEVSDYRSDEYADRIRAFLDDPDISDKCVCTGFIERSEQLALMRGARFLIQPSLFEGWGTVLEDAKVLDKCVLLSDIPIHREQMSEECTLFDPQDVDELARMILYTLDNKRLCDNVDYGIENMYSDARDYSTEFERMLRSQLSR